MHRHSLLKHEIPRGGPKESLMRHGFRVQQSPDELRMTTKFRRFIIGALFCTTVLLAVGISLKSFHFDIKGLTGHILGDKSVESYSLISLGTSLSASVENPNSFGIKIIQITFFFFAIVMPFGTLIILLVLFCIPMTVWAQRLTFIIAEIASAWSATEVFLLSVLTALWQLSQFAKFIVGDKCDLINQILKEYFVEELGEKDTFCFDIDARAGSKSIVLIFAVIMSTFMTTFLLRIAHQALDERMEQEGDIDGEEVLDNENLTVMDRLYKSRWNGYFLTNNWHQDFTMAESQEESFILNLLTMRDRGSHLNQTDTEEILFTFNERLINAVDNIS